MSQNQKNKPNTFITGVRGRCPECGEGRLFSGFLQTREDCEVCGTSFDAEDAGDGPAVFIMLIVGFIVVGGALAVEILYKPPYWVHAVLWGPLAILLPLLILQPLKGWWIVNQYHRKAHEGKIDKT